jgi:hypothetical protein
MSRHRLPRHSRSSIRDLCRGAVGYKPRVTNARRFALDELTLRPGTYFNPQTEIMIVVDDSPEVDHELFEMDEFDSDDWVLIAEEVPVDEHKRDELVERFQQAYTGSSGLTAGDDVVDEPDELDADELDELDVVDEPDAD